ncbi:hypothetical protein [Mesorhizobium sp. 8]|nr:hypothetical protein [Mesorhizobium sp. 8]
MGDGAWLPAAIGRFMEFLISLRPHVPFGKESPEGVAHAVSAPTSIY